MNQIYVLLNAVLCNMRSLLLAAENNKEKERNETGLQVFVANGGCLLDAGWN